MPFYLIKKNKNFHFDLPLIQKLKIKLLKDAFQGEQMFSAVLIVFTSGLDNRVVSLMCSPAHFSCYDCTVTLYHD